MIAPSDTVGRAKAVQAALPAGGLFHEKAWRVAPSAFPLNAKLVAELEKLGHRLTLFLQACSQLYRLSADGRQPGWIAELLDAGKPKELVEQQRNKPISQQIPRIIRPDIILTDHGFIIAELDNVPGGIGLTGWLNKIYADLGDNVLGGPEGMLDGFASIFPGGDIVISEEASTYRPEMEWLAAALNAKNSNSPGWRVRDAQDADDFSPEVYRFFELFDLANVPAAGKLRNLAAEGKITVTPPFRPALEEKLWFALFWLRPLEAFWTRALGGRTFSALQEVIPYTWLVDPTPLPPHAVLPRLEVNDWSEVAAFSQKQRNLILKISGFSEQAWGSRGVIMAQDVPQPEWQKELSKALEAWPSSPHILQQFHQGRLVEHDYLDPSGEEIIRMRGRVRLCPYYFIGEQKTVCGGALATICPDDKKLLHGMTDAILTPACKTEDA